MTGAVGTRRAAAALVSGLLALAGCREAYTRPPAVPAPGQVVIGYYGHSMIRVADRVHAVVVDPLDPHTGFPFPKVSADVVLVSQELLGVSNVASVAGSPAVFREPGVFVAGELRVVGIPSDTTTGVSGGRNVMYRWRMEGIGFAHLGGLASARLDDSQEALLAGVDVLFVPVGGKRSIDASGAAAIVERLKPRVAIPVQYRVGPSTLGIAYVDSFVRRMVRVRRVPSALAITEATLPRMTETWVMDWRG